MRIYHLKLSNFRCVAEGEIFFQQNPLMIGGNGVGKSNICEALDLLLGPDRLSRSSLIDEHDFFEHRYLDCDGPPIPIRLEVVLTDLPSPMLTRFRLHREYWNTDTDELLDEIGSPEDVDDDSVIPALRISFERLYDVEGDEFRARTYFASPLVDGDEARRWTVNGQYLILTKTARKFILVCCATDARRVFVRRTRRESIKTIQTVDRSCRTLPIVSQSEKV